MLILQTLLNSATRLPTFALLYIWGENTYGNLGIGTTTNRSSPVLVGNRSWSQVSIGTFHTLAIDSTNKLWVWGDNTNGQLGINSNINRSSPVQLGNDSWVSVSAYRGTTLGHAWSAGVRSNGGLWVWGNNFFFQLGNNDLARTTRSNPVQIAVGTSFNSVSIGGSHGLAIDSTNKLWGWGQNDTGQTSVNVFNPQIAYIKKISVIGQSGSNATNAYIREDGSLYTWGINNVGQLGLGDTIARSRPTLVPGSNFVDIAAGASNMVAIDNLGRMWAWGINTSNQVGDGTSINRSSPVEIGIGNSWTAIATSGFAASLAISNNNTLWVWGANTGGGLGGNLATSARYSAPVQLGTSSWSIITASRNNSYAGITTDQRLFVWGQNNTGELGTNSTIARSSPVQLAGTWSKIAFGLDHTIAIRNDTSVFIWGGNSNGQLGIGTTINRSSPILVFGAGAKEVAAGVGITIIQHNGLLWSMGSGNNGVLGIGLGTGDRSNPTLISSIIPNSDDSEISQQAAGFGVIYNLSKRGSLYSQGAGNNFDTGALQQRSAPTQVFGVGVSGWFNSTPVQIGVSSWSQVSAGSDFSNAIDSSGRLFSWGDNSNFQLGDNTTINKSSPVQIFSGNQSSFLQISSGFNHTLGITNSYSLIAYGSSSSLNYTAQPYKWSKIGAIKVDQIETTVNNYAAIADDGTLYTWGSATGFGELGVADRFGRFFNVNRSVPVLVSSENWSFVAVGAQFGGAIKSDGSLWTWGINNSGTLGDNSTINKSSPIQVGNLSWSSISAGSQYFCGITNDGKLYAWGNSANGSLGGPPSNLSNPTQIGASSWNMVTSGDFHNLAIDTAGRLFVWGSNTNGQLGLGTTINRSSPVQLPAPSGQSWSLCFASGDTSAAITNNGSVFVWGNNILGKLGNLSAINRSSPILLAGSWSKISMGAGSMYGIRPDGTLWSWGNNQYGELGLGFGGGSRSSPVQVGTDADWIDVEGGLNCAFAIKQNKNLYSFGYGGLGNLGTNTANNRSNPTLITSASINPLEQNTSAPLRLETAQSWISVGAGVNQSAAINNSSKLYVWGNNNFGNLGLSDTINRSNPTQLGNLNYGRIFGGFNQTGALGEV